MKKHLYLLLTFLVVLNGVSAQFFKQGEGLAHTFSIVARDSVTGEMAVAVQSHWFSVGTLVSWAEAGVGAIATQSFVNKSFGIRGLDLLRRGLTAQQALDLLLSDDEGREVRQVAIVDSRGNVAGFTGKNCIPYASHITGTQFSVQSNMMLGNRVCESMAEAYKKAVNKPLADRLLDALDAGQKAGGDIRGKQSAAILVVPARTNGRPWDERSVDLRVEDAKTPIIELRRLYTLHLAYQHMNNGDLATEQNDMNKAMNEYSSAMKLVPDNLEMQYWTAITLANNKETGKAIPMLKKIFAKDKNWKELTRRLPDIKLLTVNDADFKKIMAL